MHSPRRERKETELVSVNWNYFRTAVLIAGGVTLITLLGAYALACSYVYLVPSLPSTDSMRNVELQVPLRVYTRSGALIAQIGEQRRIPVGYDQLPDLVKHAFLAAEDERFFEHHGIDYFGVVRAVLIDLRSGDKSQGASTITMQAARNMFLNLDKTYRRKLQETFVTYRMEHEFTKPESFGLYLNVIFFGQRAYGVAAPAEAFSGKSLDKLDVAEAATIAGVPKAPSRYNPIVDPQLATGRRAYVLRRMRELGYIDAATAEAANKEPMQARAHAPLYDVEAPYVAEMARLELRQRFGANAETAGYRVYTTIDGRLQASANRAVRVGQIPEAQSALVALDPNDGSIVALVGGFDYFTNKYNRVTQARRLPGSGFKPFLYSAALENGLTPATVLLDAPIVLDANGSEEAWRPENSTRSFAGPTRLREALVRSRNLVSIRILKDLGVGTAIDYIARFGFDPRSMPHDLTLALGTLQATPLDVAAGYAVFANGGYRVTPYFIDRIEDGSGAVVSRAAPRMVCAQCDEGGAQSVGAEPLRVSDPAHGEPAPLPADQVAPRVISAQNAYLMSDMMSDVIKRGTGRRALALRSEEHTSELQSPCNLVCRL